MADTANGTGVNNTENVGTVKGVQGGYFFTAPKGTDVPTDYGTKLSEAFVCEGFVSEDGFEEAVDGKSENIVDMNGDIVYSYNESKTETLTLTLIEIMSDALKLQYGSKNVDVDSDGKITVRHKWSESEEELIGVLELVLKDGRRWRKVIPKCKVTELGEFKGSSTEVTGREITLTYLADGNGVTCYDYIGQATEDTQAVTSFSDL